MKKIYYLLFLSLLFSLTLSAQSTSVNPIAQLNWLEGRWERVMNNPDQTAFEEWEVKNGMLVGKGVTLQGTDTVFVENLSILLKEDKLYYVADVDSNIEPTYFRITSYSKNGFISENPEHDFPKQIEYQLTEEGELTATISGDGQSIPFLFRKK